MPLVSHSKYCCAAKRAPAGLQSYPLPSPSVIQISTFLALGPQYLSIKARVFCAILGNCCTGLAKKSASVFPPPYLCRTTKSIYGPQSESTWLFQSGSTPSGQSPGTVSTVPILIVLSWAFIALAKATTLRPYVVGERRGSPLRTLLLSAGF